MNNRLIVGYDGSENSLTALRWAAEEAELRNAAVRVISSYSFPPLMDYYGIGSAVATPVERQQLKDACLDTLRVAVAESVHSHPRLGFDFKAVDGLASRVLVDEAVDADLLVVGSSGAGPVRSFLLGSVTASVLHESHCPVVVVPAKFHNEVRRIAVGCDGSQSSDRAVAWAADEAALRDVELVVCHAWVYPYRLTQEGFDRGSDVAQVGAALVVERAAAIARERTTRVVTERLVEDGAAQALLDASDTADLVVVGCRGRGGFRSMVLGSVTLAVTAHAACAVVVVH